MLLRASPPSLAHRRRRVQDRVNTVWARREAVPGTAPRTQTHIHTLDRQPWESQPKQNRMYIKEAVSLPIISLHTTNILSTQSGLKVSKLNCNKWKLSTSSFVTSYFKVVDQVFIVLLELSQVQSETRNVAQLTLLPFYYNVYFLTSRTSKGWRAVCQRQAFPYSSVPP